MNPEEQTLRQAVARNSAMVLSLPSAGMLRHCKSRFLGEHDGGIVIQSAPGEKALLASLIQSAEPCGIAYKAGTNKVAFTSPILELLPQWQVNAEANVEALRLAFPTEIKSLQRRAYYRTKVPAEYGMKVRIWRIPEHHFLRDQPPFAQEIRCQIRDISVGGFGLCFLGNDGKPPKILPGERLRLEIKAGEHQLILEGRMREPKNSPTPDSITTGVTFKKLEDNLDGRQNLAALTRIVGELQREELRQLRLGMAQAG
jgi:c-di-GMP-binding flagellar brake protein YcgR